MLKPLFTVLALAGIPVPALAEDPAILAGYSTNSGSLPPDHAWDTSVVIHRDGPLKQKHCRRYETEGPACTNRAAMLDPPALGAITEATRASGLISSPASVDAARASAVLQTIPNAILCRFNRILQE